MPFLVDWWDGQTYYAREGRRLEHARRVASVDLLAMYNRPEAVFNLQALYDRVLALMGVK